MKPSRGDVSPICSVIFRPENGLAPRRIASIGIQIGGIATLAPNQRSPLAQIGVKALLGGSIACFLTACVASMLT